VEVGWGREGRGIFRRAGTAGHYNQLYSTKPNRTNMSRTLRVWQIILRLLLICSVLLPSIGHTMDVLLYLSLSSVILIDSSTGNPVHVLISSIQAVCGLPRLRARGNDIVPCIISFSRQLYRSDDTYAFSQFKVGERVPPYPLK